MDIAIWGFGVYGSNIYKHISENNNEYKVKLLFDINPEGVKRDRIPGGYEIKPVSEIKLWFDKGTFGAVLVCIKNQSIREGIENQLHSMDIPVIPLELVLDEIYQLSRYPDYMKIISRMQDEQSVRFFKTRLLMRDGIEKPFLEAVLQSNQGYDFYSGTIKRMRASTGIEDGVIVFGLGKDAEVNKTALKLLGVKIKAFCDLEENLSADEYIRPEDLMKKEYINCPILISSGERRAELYAALRQQKIPENRIFDRPESYRALITAIRQTQYFDVWKAKLDEVYVDCGAFDGQSITDFYNWCEGTYSRIYAFEPVLSMKNKIEEHCRDYKNVSVIYAAAWSADEELKFTVMDDLSGSTAVLVADNSYTTTVPGVALDNVIREKITFLKMDIEGSEVNAIKGARNLIQTWKPRLAISVYHTDMDIYDIPKLLLELVPEYRFLIRHYGAGLYETVLFASVNGNDFEIQ